MTTGIEAARAFRTRLASAAAALRPDPSLRLLAKSRAPLSRHGQPLGEVETLLRLSFRAHGAEGVLAFDWPDTAGGHSALAELTAWSQRAVRGETCDPVEVERRRVASDPNADANDATHLKLRFPLASIPDAMLELLAFCVRTGVARRLTPEIEKALETAAAPIPESRSESETEPTPESAPEPAPKATPEPAPKPGRELSAEDLARADAIEHGAVFDAGRHPRVDLNHDVTNSAGQTFRLVTKRAGGVHRRVWTRVRARDAAALTAPVAHAGRHRSG